MADAPAPIPSTPADVGRAKLAASKAAADAEMARLTSEYQNGTEQKLERDRTRLNELRNDPHHLNRSLTSEIVRNEEAMLAARIRDAENQIAADPDRVTLDPKLDPAATRRVSYGQQIPIADFEDAVDDLLKRGM